MSSSLEYHVSVRHSIPASVAFLSLLGLLVVLVSSAHAQINGASASGFGGRAFNGPSASVTSLGPISTSHAPRNGENYPHHHHYVASPVIYAVPVPYAVDLGATDDDTDNSADDNYQGGPTIFDRRGSGAASYIPPVRNVPTPHATRDDDVSADPDSPQEPTLLIFKDGHKLEVGNYAIIGQTLFDLTPGHARKIALTDLDIEATRQQNDDHGITFQLPQPPQAN